MTATGIDVAAADGSDRRTVARRGAYHPVWSPDGSRLAFVRSRCYGRDSDTGNCDFTLGSIFVVDAAGGGERRLTGPISPGAGAMKDGGPADDAYEPTWSSGGAEIVFARYQWPRLYVMNADGTCERPFGPLLNVLDVRWRPGYDAELPRGSCVDLRVRAEPIRERVGPNETRRLRIVVENDGTVAATRTTVSLRIDSGPGLVPRCRACTLGTIPPGRSRRLVAAVTRTRLGTSVTATARST